MWQRASFGPAATWMACWLGTLGDSALSRSPPNSAFSRTFQPCPCRLLDWPCRARPADPIPDRGGPERRRRPRPDGTGPPSDRQRGSAHTDAPGRDAWPAIADLPRWTPMDGNAGPISTYEFVPFCSIIAGPAWTVEAHACDHMGRLVECC